MVDIAAIGAVSPLGAGRLAWSNGLAGERALARLRRVPLLERAGLRRPFAGPAMRWGAATKATEDPATGMLLEAFTQIADRVTGYARLGLVLGTSSGGMCSFERVFDAQAAGSTDATSLEELLDAATYHGPYRALLRRLLDCGCNVTARAQLVTACASSTLALAIGGLWLERGDCDAVLAGGYDALSVFVAAGFEALGATTSTTPPRPLRIGRDGMAIGEGAGLALLVPAGTAQRPWGRLLGFGASGDAVHITAPDRTGSGVARSVRRALQDASLDADAVDLVSLHGTGTPFNDLMESKALQQVLGDRALAVPCHAPKASLGHTLGAAGVLESALLVDALSRGMLPASAGEGALDPDVGLLPCERNTPANLRYGLKLSSAFAGANAALVLAAPSVPARGRVRSFRSVTEVAAVDVLLPLDLDAIARDAGVPRERFGRMDGVCHLALAAVTELARLVGRERLVGAGIVLGSVLCTHVVNGKYLEQLRMKGARAADGRRFAYTTPNAAVGECAIAFQLTGPNLAVSRGADASLEAEEVGRLLVAAGACDRILVLSVDAPGAPDFLAARFSVRVGAQARLLEAADGAGLR